MSDKTNTLYVTAEQEQLDALRIQLGMRMKLSEWDQVNHALNRNLLSGIAIPMGQMLDTLLKSMRSKSAALPHPTNTKEGVPCATAEFDTDAVSELAMLVHFTFTLEQWRGLVDQLFLFQRSGPVDRLYQALLLAKEKLSGKFTVDLVGGKDKHVVTE